MCSTVDFNTCQLVQPLFVVESLKSNQEIPGLPKNFRMNDETVLQQIEQDLESGVRHFILFGVPENKSSQPSNFSSNNKVISKIKKQFGSSLNLWVDTCLCSWTDHGHCCVFHSDGKRDHEKTLHALAQSAVEAVEAGAQGISPSDMMDGRVSRIREALDSRGFIDTPIMSYSTKFASNFYGPFRHAADSAPKFGDRTQYQIDVRNRDDALNASLRCAEEGADLLMIKPGMTAIDLIAPIREATGLPVGAYQVSGEYASLALLAQNSLINFDQALKETWHVFKRAGAQYIITYGARLAKNLGVKSV
jgi:porphobilinogen synthase